MSPTLSLSVVTETEQKQKEEQEQKLNSKLDIPVVQRVTIHWVYRFRSKINSFSVSTFITSKVLTPTLLRSTILRYTDNSFQEELLLQYLGLK